jgi:Phage tail assembly chaperone protein
MSVWSYYEIATGCLTGAACEAGHAPPCLPGLALVPGLHDHHSHRVRLITDDHGTQVPVVIDWQPPAPADDELRTWAWDAAARRWLPQPTAAAHDANARAERGRRLAACDWVVARAMERAEPVPAPWAAYRQALRDVTTQAGWPDAIAWPQAPT